MSPDDLAQILALDSERSGIEFKIGRPRTDKPFAAKVAKAALGMSNRRDGGLIILGVEETPQGLVRHGLDEAALETWRNDLVADLLSQYADPPLTFTIKTVELDNRKYVVIAVGEFLDAPTICRRASQEEGGAPITREGACYVRPRRKPETTEIPTYADMRDLLDLALAKNLRRYVETAQAAGVTLSIVGPGGTPSTTDADADRYAKQLEDLQ